MVRVARTEASLAHKHARDCRKAPAECLRCKWAIAWFGELPKWLLSRVLAE